MKFAASRLCLLICAAFCFSTACVRAENPSAAEIIAKAVDRSQKHQSDGSSAAYTYTKVSVTQELDAAGRVKEHKEKVYQIWFQDGLTRVKLLEVNGHAPSDSDLKEQTENESNARQLTGSKSDRGDNRENLLTPELVGHFDFQVVGETVVNGRKAFELSFRPKSPEPPAHKMLDRFLNRISGTVWIDAEEFEVARADMHLRSEVNILGGVVGSLKKLAYTVTRTRVADGVWLNTYSSGDFEGRKLIDSMRIKTKSLAKNFRPLS